MTQDTKWRNVLEASGRHPRGPNIFSYGTAGFRMKSDILDPVLFRVGLLAVLRSRAKNGKTIGVMVTASHNPIEDNGVKLVDPMGEMLEASWERHATALSNAEDKDVVTVLRGIIAENTIDMDCQSNIAVARDTRPSGEALVKSLIDGIQALQGEYQDFGLLSTPQLHYIVRCQNTQGRYGEPTEEGYLKKLSGAFLQLWKMSNRSQCSPIKVDGANGIGAMAVRNISKYFSEVFTISVYNDGSKGELNKECGADYVKVQQSSPEGFPYQAGDRCVSFDGDADRIVFFYKNSDDQFQLLDGDKIATIIAAYLKEKLDIVGITLSKGLGVVQTAYANGSSTDYLEHFMKVPVACVKTGVKHLHHKAQEFDIGVYFEANGHGTVLFSDEAEEQIRKAAKESDKEDNKKTAAMALSAFIDLTNQTVGDAISDLLLVEIILHEKRWGCEDWNKCYRDLPNRQRKVQVKDRTVIETTDAERKVSSPIELQGKIDECVRQHKKARAFVRPSGTEDVVRVYAEAETQESTNHLAQSVSQLVYDLCGGVGPRP